MKLNPVINGCCMLLSLYYTAVVALVGYFTDHINWQLLVATFFVLYSINTGNLKVSVLAIRLGHGQKVDREELKSG